MPGTFQRVNSAHDVHGHVFRGLVDGGHDVAKTGEMEHELRISEELVLSAQLPQVPRIESETRVIFVVCQVGHTTTREIVDDTHTETAHEEAVHHVASYEAGATCDYSDRGAAHRAYTMGFFSNWRHGCKQAVPWQTANNRCLTSELPGRSVKEKPSFQLLLFAGATLFS